MSYILTKGRNNATKNWKKETGREKKNKLIYYIVNR